MISISKSQIKGTCQPRQPRPPFLVFIAARVLARIGKRRNLPIAKYQSPITFPSPRRNQQCRLHPPSTSEASRPPASTHDARSISPPPFQARPSRPHAPSKPLRCDGTLPPAIFRRARPQLRLPPAAVHAVHRGRHRGAVAGRPAECMGCRGVGSVDPGGDWDQY